MWQESDLGQIPHLFVQISRLSKLAGVGQLPAGLRDRPILFGMNG